MNQKTNWLTDKNYRFIYKQVPRACVDVLIFTKNGFLLSKRDIPPHKGLWHFTGGRVYLNERIQEAVRRIAATETGVKLKEIKPLGFCEIFIPSGPNFHDISLVFKAKIKSGKIRGSAQAQEIKAFKKIPGEMVPAHKRFLKANWREIRKILNRY